MDRLKRHHASFKNAIEGIIWIIKTQHNFQIHLLLSFIALLLCVILQVTRFEMIVILAAIFFGLVAEMINTSIEAMTDLITIEWRKEAKVAKDVSAGMMLIVAMGTLIIACFIFVPRFIDLFFI